MNYIIFSDLHGNLESLQSFERKIASLPYDKIVCLGDTAGYGADPNACLDWVRDNADIHVSGNHDYGAVGKTDISYFNPWAYDACLWTRAILSEENKRFLASSPVIKEEDGILWAHSSPFEPEAWHYITSMRDGAVNFSGADFTVCFVGHSHKPVILEQRPNGEILDYKSTLWDFEPDSRYIINVGSLGQPRDGIPSPAFVHYDTEERRVVYHRIDYEMELTQRKILENGLPAPLAERLSGGW